MGARVVEHHQVEMVAIAVEMLVVRLHGRTDVA
jgi:hypothetical protein